MRDNLLPLGLGLLLAVSGLAALNGAIVAMAVPLILFAAVRTISSLEARPPILEVARHLEQVRVTEGDQIDATLRIENPGSRLPLIMVEDTIPTPIVVSEGASCFLGALPSADSQELEYVLEIPRGRHEMPGLRVSTWTPWGLSLVEHHIPVPETLRAHPRYEILDPITIRPRQTRAFAGPVRANQGGIGLDFFGCRAYTTGDDVRRINWRAFARTGSLIVNDYELERIADVNIVLDARLRSHVRASTGTTFDHSVRAAAAMATHFLDQGNNVGLLIYGDHINWVFPGIGSLQRERILDALMSAEPTSKAVFEDLRNIPTRLFPARSQLVFVSPEIDQADTEVLGMMVERGYSILLVSPHVGAHGMEDKKVHPMAVDLANRTMGLKRTLFLDTLAKLGTDVIDWEIHSPLRVAAHGLHHSRVRRYRR